MQRFILTGAPGSGKTSVLLHLQRSGHAVVAEAATDVIAAEHASGTDEPWMDAAFIDKIIDLQRARQLAAASARVQFFDRSPVCTLALARYLGHPESPALARELARIAEAAIYQPTVFFVRLLGSIEPTAARRITYAESLEFERLHENVYRELGYRLIDVPAMSVALRASLVARNVVPS
jgi:predicted ATPase